MSETKPTWKKLVAEKVPVTWMPMRASKYEREDSAAIEWGFERWVRYVPTDNPAMHGYELAIKIPEDLVEAINGIPFDDGGGGIILHRCDHPKCDWQITYLDGNGKPWSHEYRDDVHAAVTEIRTQGATMLGPRAAFYNGTWVDAVVSMDDVEDAIKTIARNGALGRPVYDGVRGDIARNMQAVDPESRDSSKPHRSASEINFARGFRDEAVARFCDTNSRYKGWDMYFHATDGLMGFLHLEDRTIEVTEKPSDDPFVFSMVMVDGSNQLEMGEQDYEMTWSGDVDEDVKAVAKVFRRFVKAFEPKQAKKRKAIRKRTETTRLRGALV